MALEHGAGEAVAPLLATVPTPRRLALVHEVCGEVLRDAVAADRVAGVRAVLEALGDDAPRVINEAWERSLSCMQIAACDGLPEMFALLHEHGGDLAGSAQGISLRAQALRHPVIRKIVERAPATPPGDIEMGPLETGAV